MTAKTAVTDQRLAVITPDWPAPPNVRALTTTRQGGVSVPPWDSFNLAEHVGDDPVCVSINRARLKTLLPHPPLWLQQVHGTVCVDAAVAGNNAGADAAFTRQRGQVCAVLTADCLPVLLCDEGGTVVAVAHAGWRGLLAGVIESTVAAMGVPGNQLIAWLGPAIGPTAFEVGAEVREAFLGHDPAASNAFVAGRQGKWMGDIQELARQRLDALDIRRHTSADSCTVSEPERFFSYRRDGVSGRMASLIWLE